MSFCSCCIDKATKAAWVKYGKYMRQQVFHHHSFFIPTLDEMCKSVLKAREKRWKEMGL